MLFLFILFFKGGFHLINSLSIYNFLLQCYNTTNNKKKKEFKTIALYMIGIGWMASGSGLFIAISNLILFIPIILLIAIFKIMLKNINQITRR